jgi:hypothetical protein
MFPGMSVRHVSGMDILYLTADSLEGRTTTRLTLWLYRDRGGWQGNLLVRSALRVGRTTREA